MGKDTPASSKSPSSHSSPLSRRPAKTGPSKPKKGKETETLTSHAVQQDAHERDEMPDLDKMEFEARSSRDYAWYDISMFLAHRISRNEVEVKVRYADFGEDEDEWVNVKRAVRVRSIPLESSECMKVNAGDLVLCFREGCNEAVHYDAHVIEIERKLHDVRGCRCLFRVKYDHDETEEKVHLSRLCRRPKFRSSELYADALG